MLIKFVDAQHKTEFYIPVTCIMQLTSDPTNMLATHVQTNIPAPQGGPSIFAVVGTLRSIADQVNSVYEALTARRH